MIEKFVRQFEESKDLPDLFELVKSAVDETIHMSRGGLMLGLADLGNHPSGFLGAFHPIGTNIIVMNKTPLRRMRETQPELWKSYAFHVLLHEYLHTLGYFDEVAVGKKVLEISIILFGKDHSATQIAADTARFFPNLVYPDIAWQPDSLHIELVDGFDRSSTGYIA